MYSNVQSKIWVPVMWGARFWVIQIELDAIWEGEVYQSEKIHNRKSLHETTSSIATGSSPNLSTTNHNQTPNETAHQPLPDTLFRGFQTQYRSPLGGVPGSPAVHINIPPAVSSLIPKSMIDPPYRQGYLYQTTKDPIQIKTTLSS